MSKDSCIFHEATIGGLSFYLTLSADGPYIGLSGTGSGVAVGSCTSVENIGTPEYPSYCVCKYRNQQRILLSGFDEATAKKFCQEVGVPFGRTNRVESAECFDESPAFQSLVAWAKKHPRLFARYSKYQDYMPWVSMVNNELHPEPDTDEYLAQTARVGDIFTVEANEMIETEWKFQIIAILEQKGDRFYVGAKIGVDLNDCQIVLFDKDGEEIDSDGRGSSLGFYLCEKTKKRSAKSFKMVGFPDANVAGKQGEVMSVTWRIHTAVTNDRAYDVSAFLSGLGDEVQLVAGHTDFNSLPYPPGEDEITGIALTTIQDATFVLMTGDKKFAKLWQFPRLLYFSREHYNVSYWMPLIEEKVPVLNRGCLFVPAGAIKFIKTTLPSLYLESKKAGIFVRPDSGLKLFTGFVLDIAPADSWEEIYRSIYQEVHPADRTMVCLSLARDLEPTEWRFWIVNRQVVASSPYSWEGPVPWCPPPEGAVTVAEAMAANPWQPDLAFVVDVVQTKNDQKFWVNEINAASTSGIYNVPLGDLLPALRDIAIKEATGEVEFSEACRLSPDEWLY